jgi:hypothetical protein
MIHSRVALASAFMVSLLLGGAVVARRAPVEVRGRGGVTEGRGVLTVHRLGRDRLPVTATVRVGDDTISRLDATGCRVLGTFVRRGRRGRMLRIESGADANVALAALLAARVRMLWTKKGNPDAPVKVTLRAWKGVATVNGRATRVRLVERVVLDALIGGEARARRGRYRAKLVGPLEVLAPVCGGPPGGSTTSLPGAATITTTTTLPVALCDGARLVAPGESIQTQVDAAAAHGGTVCVLAGSYAESLTLRSGVTLLGGVDPATLARDPAAFPTTLQGGPIAVRAAAVSGVVVDGFRITSADGTAPGGSSIAVLLTASDGLTLRGNTIVAGLGAPGADGQDRAGDAAPARGAAGGNGGAAGVGNPLQDLCEPGAGAGSGARSGGAGGAGGAVCEGGHSGAAGRTAANASAANGGAGGCESKNRCNPFSDLCDSFDDPSERGGDGPAGSAGTHGTGGGDFGSLDGGGYSAANGTAATSGGHGAGGGGGGGGPGAVFAPSFVCGAGGGGGGQGGLGGAAGGTGTGGGASIGIAVLEGSTATLTGNEVTTAAGGAGGRGGRGQLGGPGGAGGSGGRGFGDGDDFDAVGASGGGDGGPGGRGGDAGGGGGGPSIGLAIDGDSAADQQDNVFDLGPAGPGGNRAGAAAGTAGAGGRRTAVVLLP